MNVSRFFAAAALAATVTLSACGGGGGGPAGAQLPTTTQPPTGTFPSSLANFSWEKDLLKSATVVGPADPGATLGMSMVVNMRDAAGLVRYATDVSDPTSGSYRHFLTPQDIADRFGATQSDYQSTAAYFAQNGLHVSGWPQREAIFVTGSVASFQRAFNTPFSVYRAGSQQFIAPSGAPHTSVVVPIHAVVGMVHAPIRNRYNMGIPSGNFRGYSPQQEQRAFDFTGAAAAGYDGTGVNVAIVGTGPISSADVPALGQLFNTKVGTVTQVNVTDQGVSAGLAGNPTPSPTPSASYPYSSGFQSPPPVTASCHGTLPTCNPEDIEAQLDTESIASMATGASVLFYLGYNPNDCYLATGNPQNNTPCGAGQGVPGEGIAVTDPEIQQIIADNKADVVSMSFGLGEPFGIAGYLFSSGSYTPSGYGYGPIEMATMVAEGMAVFASSGDTGAYECGGLGVQYLPGNPPCVSYPAGDPSVVSVGGVLAPLNTDGTLRTEFSAWGYQTFAGGDGTYQNNIGSGGGISTVFPAPKWQAAYSDITSLGKGMRVQPDISMMGDPNSGPTIVANAFVSPQVFAEGGTSLAAPQMAAMWSLVVQACMKDSTCTSKGTGAHPYRLGNPAPLLYAMYGNTKQYGSAIVDVLYGNNSANNPGGTLESGYSAGPGYDMVTGLGVPIAGKFIDAVLTQEGNTSPPAIP